MSEINQQYKAKGLEILFAAVNPNPNVPEFIQRYQIPFPVGTVDDGKAREFMQFPMVRPAYVPWLVVIDRKGIIRFQFSGTDGIFERGVDGIRKLVDPLLAEKAAPAPPPRKAAKRKGP